MTARNDRADAPVRIAMAMGDPCGISPELAAKLLARQDVVGGAAILVIGDRRILAAGESAAKVTLDLPVVRQAAEANLGPGRPVMLDLGHCDPASIKLGEASAAGGSFAMRNFRLALELAKAGRVDAVLFTPFNKAALKLAGNPYEDEIHFAADVLGFHGPASEFNVLGSLWNARVTSHVPLAKVASLLTRESVLGSLVLADQAMRMAGFDPPRIAMAALNPHAGDGGNFGREEIDVLAPVAAEGRARGIAVEGPFPADTVFLRAKAGQFDAVLTMFHDQGQIAMKLMGFERGVTVLGGLPVPICTPAHGTAYDIAGQGKANVEASVQAFLTACAMGEKARRARAA